MRFRIGAMEFTADTQNELISSAARTFGGNLEVWAGKWWWVSKEGCPFTVTRKNGLAYVSTYYPPLRSKEKGEAEQIVLWDIVWRIASRNTSFWEGIPEMSKAIVTAARKPDLKVIK